MNKKQAFTLIEVLIVIVVIGIISSFIIVSVSSITQRATIAKGQAFSTSIKNSLMMNLVSEWRLNETSGTNVSDQWGTNNGTWSGPAGSYTSPSWRTSSECVSNGCLAFDGTDDYVGGTLSGISNTKRWATAFWIKTTNTDAQPIDTRTANLNGLDLHIFNPNSLYLYLIQGGDYTKMYTYSLGINNGSWHQILIQRNDDNSISLYFDATLLSPLVKNIDTDISSISETWSSFTLGARHSHDSYFLNGSIDDVRIYNAAIPTSLIWQNYYSGVNKLFKNQGISLEDYNQRITELVNNVAKQ